MCILNPLYKLVWKYIEHLDNKRMPQLPDPDDVDKFMDYHYMDDDKKEHLFDVYMPKDTPKDAKLPVILDIHGGGLMYGYKIINENYNLWLAHRGFVVFSINYTLTLKKKFPQCAFDVGEALQYIDKNLENWPCDRDKFFITGDSAGAFLALIATLMCKDKEYRKAFGIEADITLDPKALGLTSPALDYREKPLWFIAAGNFGFCGQTKCKYAKELDFAKVVNKDNIVPTFLVSSEEDFMANETKIDAEFIKNTGVDTQFEFYPAGQNGYKLEHVFSVSWPSRPESVEVIDNLTSFFLKHAEG